MKQVAITVGIGMDIINCRRFDRLLSLKGSSFASRLSKRLLHPIHELPRFESIATNSQRVQFISGSWAAKEAVFKTLDSESQKLFLFKEWYKSNDKRGKPFISSDKYDSEDEQFLLTITHDADFVAATVLRQRIIDLTSSL